MSACFECGKAAQHEHHVVPRSLGGTKTVWLCERHHGLVHDRSFLNHAKLTRLGLEKARRLHGKFGGRPAVYSPMTIKRALSMVMREGKTIREASRSVGMSQTQLHYYLCMLRKTDP